MKYRMNYILFRNFNEFITLKALTGFMVRFKGDSSDVEMHRNRPYQMHFTNYVVNFEIWSTIINGQTDYFTYQSKK